MAVGSIPSHFDLEETQIRDLISLLNEITPSETIEDQPIWRCNKNGVFSVKSIYHHFIDSGVNLEIQIGSEAQNAPPKSRCFFGLFTKMLSSHGQHYKDGVGQT